MLSELMAGDRVYVRFHRPIFRWVPRGLAHPFPGGRCWLPPARVFFGSLLSVSAPPAGSTCPLGRALTRV
jgi:hypothetical protein